MIFFNSSSEWVRKLQRQLSASTAHFAQELPMNVQCNRGSRSFAKETRALKMSSIVASHWKLTMANWEPSSKPILLQLPEKLPKRVISIWSKLERWKGSISECLMSWPKKKKNRTTMNHFSISLWHAMKSRFYVTTSSVVGLGRSSKALLKPNLH